jgi:hypothetical protein
MLRTCWDGLIGRLSVAGTKQKQMSCVIIIIIIIRLEKRNSDFLSLFFLTKISYTPVSYISFLFFWGGSLLWALIQSGALQRWSFLFLSSFNGWCPAHTTWFDSLPNRGADAEPWCAAALKKRNKKKKERKKEKETKPKLGMCVVLLFGFGHRQWGVSSLLFADSHSQSLCRWSSRR